MPKAGLPLKWYGGKSYVAKHVIELLKQRPHIHYVEPYFGGGQVLFKRDPEYNWAAHNGESLPGRLSGCSELVNDIHSELMNFYEVLRDPELFPELFRQLNMLTFNEEVFANAAKPAETAIERAVRLFARCRMSHSADMKTFATPVRKRTRGKKQDQVNAFLSAVDGLGWAHDRLRRVMVLNRDAIKVIQSEDKEGTCFYLDPPYLHETRVTTANYTHEMSRHGHQSLLDTIRQVKGGVILSGYPNDLYDKTLRGWNVTDIELKKSASAQKTKPKAIERLWHNF